MPTNKYRQYSVVIHNVKENIQDEVKQYAAQAKEFVMSVEAYPQGGGYHLHLFLQYPNQRSFKSVLGDLQKFSRTIVTSKPPGEERDWGRVQIDVMKGSFQQAHDYLLGVTKDKPIGEVTHRCKKPCWRRRRYTQKIGDMKHTEEFCGRCESNTCMGCCPGCILCDPEISEQYDLNLLRGILEVIQK